MNSKNWKVFTSKFVGTGPSSYEKRIYLAAVSQILRNTALQCPGLLCSQPSLLFDIYRCFSPVVRRPRGEVDLSPPYIAEVMNEWS